MVWRADLFGSLATSAVVPTTRLLGLTEDKSPTRRRNVAVRALKTLAFDLPVTWFFVSWNHEYGHIMRANEAGIEVVLRRVGTPWTYPRFDLIALDYPSFTRGSMFDLGAESGGLEAGWVLKDRLEDAARARPLDAGEAMTAVWAGLNTTLYAHVNTPDDLFQQVVPSGDVARYAHQWILDSRRYAGSTRGSQSEQVTRLRRRTLLNLVDGALLSNAFGVLHDYVWHGRETVQTRTLTVRGVRIIPALRYSLTPIGPELAVRTTVRSGRTEWKAYYRSAETITTEAATGFGVQHSRVVAGRFDSRLDLDFWRQPSSRRGSRQLATVSFQPWTTQRDRFVEVAVGRKSAGYLQGEPMKAGWQLRSTVGFHW
ncbi:MAG: hypothetical protein AMXMBFR57_06840 [Acidimicrobiia bacterium]|jgi:hypothetical protein